MDYLDLPAVSRAQGTVKLPGSKSISNRMLLLAALAEGTTDIHDLLVSDDVQRMLDALKQLGVSIEVMSGVYRVTGVGGAFPVKKADLFLGNAGTAFRPLTAALALCGGHYRLSGVPRMHERPIGDLVDGLRQVGANVQYELARCYYSIGMAEKYPAVEILRLIHIEHSRRLDADHRPDRESAARACAARRTSDSGRRTVPALPSTDDTPYPHCPKTNPPV